MVCSSSQHNEPSSSFKGLGAFIWVTAAGNQASVCALNMSMPHNPGFLLLGSIGLLQLHTVVVLIALEEVSAGAHCCNGDASVGTRKVNPSCTKSSLEPFK